jgi:O-antigen/teichoic acid export membrane protein
MQTFVPIGGTMGFRERYFSDSRNRKMILGSGFLLINTIINQVARLIIVAILARYYSKEQFGVWVVITSTTAVLLNSDFGIGNALRNKLAVLSAKGKESDDLAREYFLSIFYFFLCFGILLSTILLVFSNRIPFNALFRTSDEVLQNTGAGIILFIQILSMVGIPFGIGTVAFFSYQESQWYAIVGIVQSIFSFVTVGVLVFLRSGITYLAICYFATNLLIGILATGLFLRNRRWSPLNIEIRNILPRVFNLLPLSMRFFVTQISYAFIQNAPTIVLSVAVGVSEAAEYNLIQKVNSIVLGLYLSVFNPLWAAYSEAAAKKDWAWCRRTFVTTMSITLLLFSIFIVFMLGAGKTVLVMLGGEKYSITNQVLFVIMGFWILSSAISSCASIVLNAFGEITLSTIMSVAIAILASPLLSWLAKRMGLYGIGVGTLLLSLPGTVIVTLQVIAILWSRKRKLRHLEKDLGNG